MKNILTEHLHLMLVTNLRSPSGSNGARHQLGAFGGSGP